MKTLLLIDETRGIYIPFDFYHKFDFSSWGLNSSDYRDLSDPENEHYWDAWEELLEKAIHYNEDGTWRLEQDGSLFAVPAE
jgi:hypothetical protein